MKSEKFITKISEETYVPHVIKAPRARTKFFLRLIVEGECGDEERGENAARRVFCIRLSACNALAARSKASILIPRTYQALSTMANSIL